MEKSYEPQAFEIRWYAQWETSGCFKPSGKGRPYTILLPPPNVTGTLHMGHAFQHTVMDALIRYHRMRGFDTLWQVGTDHAGIATEMVVNRNLVVEGKGETRDSLGRDAFIEKVWAWKQESGDTIARQMRRLGASGDWSREVFTMDPMPSQAVIEAFVRLYEEGLIYRGQRLVNWDPVLKTAISDLEVVSEEEDGFLWSIRYNVIDPQPGEPDHLVIATTRPETMLGDVAVAVHPEDERYASLVANKRRLRLPLTEREIPVISDTYVDREFGTGAVKITPAHDFNDYAIGQRHKLHPINIFTKEAKVVGNTDWFDRSTNPIPANEVSNVVDIAVDIGIPEKYWGLDRYDARKLVLADLEFTGLLVETKKHKLQVPRGDRSGQVIEPYLTDQWFVKMDTLAVRGLDVVEGVECKPGSVKFVPENWINTYRHWMGNIQDWCISRQLWWGHRIPAWYDDAGNIYVARSEQEALAQAVGLASDGNLAGTTLPQLRQDKDVLETWFSSSLWPLSTMGWPDNAAMRERGFDRYLPTDVLVTGFDIIFFWVARMIFMTDHFAPASWPDEQRVPFREVYITGLVRDKDGQKMSKSKGNVLDPIDLIDGIALDDLVAKRTSGLMQPQMAAKIEKHTRKEFPEGIPAFGADALRFTFASLASHGRDIKFDLNRCEGYKNFCNKLWNAARFVLMNCEGFVGAAFDSALAPKTDAERWILAKLAKTIVEVETQFAAYRFDLVSQALYEFTWNTFCDWFLELAKPALQSDDAEAANSTRRTLLHVLESTLRLLHPLIPFVTEEIWQNTAPLLRIDNVSSVSLRPYPQAAEVAADHIAAEADIEWLKSVVSALRRIRSELNVAPSKQIALLLQDGDTDDRKRMARFDAQLRFLVRIDSITWVEQGGHVPPASAVLIGDLKLLIALAGLIDLDTERARLAKEIARAEAEIRKSEGKLASATFVQNAPVAVVGQERARLVEWSAQRDALRKQADGLGDA
jgi:valyl-tRNA synthetase